VAPSPTQGHTGLGALRSGRKSLAEIYLCLVGLTQNPHTQAESQVQVPSSDEAGEI
jgi:hypothetical protein